MKYAIGIDLGGTTIKGGLVSEFGEIILQTMINSEANSGAMVVAEKISEVIQDLFAFSQKNQIEISEIGIGVAGLIEHEKGVVHFSPNFEGWFDIPLVDLVRSSLTSPICDFPIVIENDGNAMAFGEFCHGGGASAKILVCMTLGTGVGGGIVIDGEIFRGSRNVGAEIGHTIIQADGALCGCGNYGCLEAYVGRDRIIERTREKIIKHGKKSILADQLDNLTPKIIADAADRGDDVAIEIFTETGRYIGVTATTIAHLLNPEMIIIGGGISAASEDLLFGPIRETVKRRAMDTNAESLRIVRAKLGNLAGLVGSAMLAMK